MQNDNNNRISAGRLCLVAQVLAVPVGYFLDKLDDLGTPDLSLRRRSRLELTRNSRTSPPKTVRKRCRSWPTRWFLSTHSW